MELLRGLPLLLFDYLISGRLAEQEISSYPLSCQAIRNFVATVRRMIRLELLFWQCKARKEPEEVFALNFLTLNWHY
jgi:hypothetical protein